MFAFTTSTIETSRLQHGSDARPLQPAEVRGDRLRAWSPRARHAVLETVAAQGCTTLEAMRRVKAGALR